MSIGREELAEVAAGLDRWRDTPDDVLADAVLRDGRCVWVFTEGDAPAPSGDEPADRELARRLCEGCTVAGPCLELEMRTAGERTTGVWGGLAEHDRRALLPLWVARRSGADGQEPGR
ncbi:WhiB family transcriptional regulator [Actinoalloteichus hymeniacidonis]|uniref:Transcription factor WhiB n=1 Tax=Actinoalloteichus hymeniacidonis TaxID=340345 RepID=A0AAC9HPY1_9PSEU|nr:WhiB family transcriptional regulator [Actinoalloteichus hymeniacidonis]AOS62841.1 Transcription factor WhiB [Actinoalloteichus hymeniacidonis]MBB5909126.1 WhiB family redox-sensing transcriptional regulator [Actinoalloteichus hymeniacidonis]